MIVASHYNCSLTLVLINAPTLGYTTECNNNQYQEHTRNCGNPSHMFHYEGLQNFLKTIWKHIRVTLNIIETIMRESDNE